MTLYRTFTRAAGLGLCVVAFAGTALADPGKGNGEPAVTPPGQEKKAEPQPAAAPTPAPAAAKGQQQKAENQKNQAAKKAAKATAKSAPKAAPVNKGQAKKAEKQAAKAAKPAKTSGSFKNTSSGTNEKKPEQTHRHTICHATGSSSNPYVRITPSLSGVFNGHMGHQDGEDIVPPATYKGASISQNWDAEGQAIFNAGCEVPTPPAVQVVAPKTEVKQEQKTEECPTATTTTERVLVGVWHATGATKDGKRKYVFITPSLASAHYDSSKHEDDIPVYDERTVTVAASAESCKQVATVTPPAPTPPVVPTPEQPQPVVPTPPGQTPAPGTIGVLPAVAPAPAGGVAGAVSPAPAEQKKESGGVLGAVASAPEAVAETVTSGTLPFTGIPLWIAALIGGGLLAAGLALRRTA